MKTNYVQHIEELEVSQATIQALKDLEIRNLGDLMNYSISGLAERLNYQKRKELIQALASKGLSLSATESTVSKPVIDHSRKIKIAQQNGQGEAIKVYKEIGLFNKIEFLQFSVRIQNVLNSIGILYLGDLVIYTKEDLLKLDNFGHTSLKEIVLKLDSLGLSLGIDLKYWLVEDVKKLAKSASLETIMYEDLVESLPLKKSFFNSIVLIRNPKYAQILEMRIGLYGKPKTLEQIGAEFNLTRERIRQIQRKVNLQMIESEPWCKALEIHIKRLMRDRQEPLFIDELAAINPWFVGFENRYDLLEVILQTFIPSLEIKFLTYRERKIITMISTEEWINLRYDLLNEFEYNIDVGYTSEDIDLIVESRLNDLGVTELTPLFLDVLSEDLHFVIKEGERVLVSVGSSTYSRIKVLLEDAVEPLHYSIITDLYEQYYGISATSRYIHSCLINNDFFLFDKGVYGLKKHLGISEELQSNLREKMEKYILAGKPGKQWHSKSLVDKFGKVDPSVELNIYSVSIILSASKHLKYLGRHAWKVKTENDESDERIEIHTVIYDSLKEAGRPLSSQELKDRVAKKRGIGDFFLVKANSLYARVDEVNWGLLDRDFKMSADERKDIKDFFYDHFMKENVAAHRNELINIFCDTIQKGVTSYLIFGLLTSDPRFKTWRGGYIGLSSWSQSGRMNLREAIYSMSEQVKAPISLNSILEYLKVQLGKSFAAASVTSVLSKSGFEYNRDTGLWEKDKY